MSNPIRINTLDHNLVCAVYSIHEGVPLPSFHLKVRARIVGKDGCPTNELLDIVNKVQTTMSDGSKEDFSFNVLGNQRQAVVDLEQVHVTQFDPTINFFGRYYVKVWIQGKSGMPETFQKLIGGLITHRYPLSWPSMVPRHLYEYDFAQFPPLIKHLGDLLAGADGLIDANWFGLKSRDIWIRSLYLKLTTDANAGNRFIHVQVQDQSNNLIWMIPAPVAIPASSTGYFTFAPGLNNGSVTSGTNIIQTIGLPEKMLFKGGLKLYIFNNGKFAGDQIQDIEETYFERVVE